MDNNFDVIIVGTGAAGLFAGLCLPRDLKILMITKDKIENSDSYLAQGGICTLKSADDFDAFYQRILHKKKWFENKGYGFGPALTEEIDNNYKWE